jgi:hypothetical protein
LKRTLPQELLVQDGPMARKLLAHAILWTLGPVAAGVNVIAPLAFLVQYLPGRSGPFGPALWSLSALGVVVGATVPSWLWLRPFERRGGVYERLGVRRFRRISMNGDLMRKAMVRISPEVVTSLRRTSLKDRESEHRFAETLHWAWLLGSLPAFIGAAIVRRWGYVLVIGLSCLVLHVYPIMLQRYMLGRLQRIAERR